LEKSLRKRFGTRKVKLLTFIKPHNRMWWRKIKGLLRLEKVKTSISRYIGGIVNVATNKRKGVCNRIY